jgi:tungstate transport system ATP-binding protein
VSALPEAAYVLDGLRFSYPVRRDGFLLATDALRVEPGEVRALVGPNGAGKTTLLMLLALLVRPTAGRILFFGRDAWGPGAAEHPVLRREAVLVTHHPYLFKGTVGDNLVYGLKIRGIPEAEWPARSRDALARVELPGWERRSAAGLSAGQVQRIALARALALRPKVLLLDEPTANIEAGLGLRIEAALSEAVRERGMTVVLSTHNLAQASRLAGSILYLEDGRIAVPPDVLVRFSPEAAGLIGTPSPEEEA